MHIDRGNIELTLGVAFKEAGRHLKAKEYFIRAENSFETAGLHGSSPQRILVQEYRNWDDLAESGFKMDGVEFILGMLPAEYLPRHDSIVCQKLPSH